MQICCLSKRLEMTGRCTLQHVNWETTQEPEGLIMVQQVPLRHKNPERRFPSSFYLYLSSPELDTAAVIYKIIAFPSKHIYYHNRFTSPTGDRTDVIFRLKYLSLSYNDCVVNQQRNFKCIDVYFMFLIWIPKYVRLLHSLKFKYSITAICQYIMLVNFNCREPIQ